MRVLLTNDDGIFADGIQAMRRALEGEADVELTVIAPDRERSATGHGITLHRPIFVSPVKLPDSRAPAFQVTGTPVDCVKLAIETILKRRPELVISGINRGANLGTDVFYSGTVSAAIEATILGVPAIAVSLATFEEADYDYAARLTLRVARRVAAEGLPRGTLLNINVPAVHPSLIEGIRITSLGVRLYDNSFHRRTHPRGGHYYWLAGKVRELKNDPDSDVEAIRANNISISPIQLDLSDRPTMQRLAEWNLEKWQVDG